MNTKKRSFLEALWDFCCSLKLTIITLILLSATSVIGTVIQQNRSPEEYLRVYGETTYRIFETLGFFNMYHSWWFLGLLALFSLNLTACSIKRLPRVWKTVFNPVLVADDDLYRTLSNMEEVVSKQSPDTLKTKIGEFLKANFAPARVTEGEDGKVHFYAEKMAWARFGVYVTHASILIILIGAIIGSVFGFKGYVNIVEGTETNRAWLRGGAQPTPIDLGFTVRVDKFSVDFYEGTRRPKLYESIVTIIDDGVEVKRDRSVIVNDPLTYKGIVFYQSSYGPAGDPSFVLKVTERATGESQTYNLRQGQPARLPGGEPFRVANFSENFQNFGPAARIEIMPQGQQVRAFTVLQAFPQFDAQRGDDYIFSLVDYNQRQYTGFQVAKDPGVWVVWIGCILLMVGSVVAFFLAHRRIWVTLVPLDGGKTGVKFGGASNRNQPGFELAFDEMKKKFKQELGS
ncbi:cytochrome c biogenesis protein ResB [Geoalkalibacter halelectricus]|uniref:Cytochrome c biogenesis protein ResB n=1 Tax=Geoalkalibacter halelectricus TaxID=2847045 RepID=A0ABY5ZGV6_9BACT|nr:cytochrome c biogenesis protein ResB [Geoalkalibacter halelectricus]UWZ77921.1 cytochrome c biogenesis protein ResB [Geoalkalibacter halelectricus]